MFVCVCVYWHFRFYCVLETDNWDIWLVLSFYVTRRVMPLLEKALILGEIAFIILLSSVWTSDLFSHLTHLKTSILIEDSPGNKHSRLANKSQIISYSSITCQPIKVLIYVYEKSIPSTYQILIDHLIKLWYYSFTTPSWPLVSWLPHVSTGLSLLLSTPTLLSDPRKEKMDVVQSMKVGIRVGEKKSCQANLEKWRKKGVCYKQ